MLKITLKNPNTQESETYDVVSEFNQMYEKGAEYGLISSIFALKVKDMNDENAPSDSTLIAMLETDSCVSFPTTIAFTTCELQTNRCRA